MQRIRYFCLFTVVMALMASEVFGVVRVARRYNVIEVFGSSAQAWGEYSEVGPVSIVDGLGRPVKVKASVLFDPSFSFGVTYGQLRNDHWIGDLGFRYLRINHNLDFAGTNVRFHQYDIDITVNYLFLRLPTSAWSPYIGASVNGGLTVQSPEGYDTNSSLTFGLSANFGLDLKLWTNRKDQSFVTLSSVNTWNAVGSGNRPRFLQIGAGLKYWFRP
ncbi:MAG: hypothetical protein JSU65_07465 [Candidatus Zixiibacteriota bacterium]|nr:MAG: hypothetical protein JSU65_07465 [candidate division Zixibacteria bacterium]